MILLLFLDLIIYSTTPYNIPLFILALPNQKTPTIFITFFLILSFFEVRYLILLIVILLIYLINKLINKNFKSISFTYYITVILDYMLYFLFYKIYLII